METRVLQSRRSTLSSHVQPGLQFTYALSKQDKEIETSIKLVRIWREIEDTHISLDCLLQGQGLRTKKRAWKSQIFINVGLTSAFWTTETTISIKDSCKLTRPQTSCSFSDNLNRRIARENSGQSSISGQYWPFPAASTSFYSPSEPQPTNQFTNRIVPCRTESPIPLAASTPPSSSAASSDSEVTNVTAKGNKSRAKSAD